MGKQGFYISSFLMFAQSVSFLSLLAVSVGLVTGTQLVSSSKDVGLNVLLVGDSIVAGQGDTSELRGLVGRLTQSSKSISVSSVALPGATSKGLSLYVSHQLQVGEESELYQKLQAADVIILSAGLNDFWSETAPRRTASRLRTLTKMLRCAAHRPDRKPPIVAIATLIPTTLESQATWSAQVNSSLNQIPSEEALIGPRFHRMEKRLLSNDGLHPSSIGYDWMATATYQLVETVQTLQVPTTAQCENYDTTAMQAAISTNSDRQRRKNRRRPSPA